ncbi:MAG: FAD synthetase [Rikenellaceae bacterium]|nr:FAD synthetase [Rikenellaceae bacterium]
MRIFYNIDDIPGQIQSPSVTVGSFDGVHSGHIQILRTVIDTARKSSGESLVVTFDPHPREIVNTNGNPIRLLNTVDEKILLLDKAGIENVLIINFNREFSKLNYMEFAEKYLLEMIGAKNIILGYNHHYGHNREGGGSTLETLQNKYDFTVNQVPMYGSEEFKISSTTIRDLISSGDIETANRYLWQNYFTLGDAVSEYEIIITHDKKLLPPEGIYPVQISADGLTVQTNADIRSRKIILHEPISTLHGEALIQFQS